MMKNSGYLNTILALVMGQCLFGGPVLAQAIDITVAAYYFPNYHRDATNERWHGKGWTEWELVKAAKPRFKGHQQPKVPAWGYFDEADPQWAAKEIGLASQHGVDVFIYDWYWYEQVPGGMYLHEGLEQGFLQAPNRQKMQFALMWANHDWLNIQPAQFTNQPEKLTEGEVNAKTWGAMTDYIISRYFKQPNYWKLDGKPYFSIYEIGTFINGFGNLDSAVNALKRFDEKTKAAGFPGLHLNVMAWGFNEYALASLPFEKALKDPQAIFRALPAASVTSYAFVHHYQAPKSEFPTMKYANALAANALEWENFAQKFSPLPYFPNVSMGWDPSPRCLQTDTFENKGYPWMHVFTDNTPSQFRQGLVKAKEYILKSSNKHKVITINAWNEWTEGSYLLPDKVNGTQYLQAIKQVLGNGNR
jgi:hypothetical protein